MDDPTEGKRDRYPMPGRCMEGPHFETRVYRLGPGGNPAFLCRRHLVDLIRIATWPHVPRNLSGAD